NQKSTVTFFADGTEVWLHQLNHYRLDGRYQIGGDEELMRKDEMRSRPMTPTRNRLQVDRLRGRCHFRLLLKQTSVSFRLVNRDFTDSGVFHHCKKRVRARGRE